ncbi:cell division protein FtsN [Colwellia sp. Arc7-635]|jgi:cell division protein FtsN|uniref:SPOR domain-containing protein n=1 Tax=Colwellia sp. Arc7-635 TaxID=2497879 RepID=UPI000F8589AD|nr:SPOR domain-containing protein [Colwellia sp. Arc7-635]AZQ83020.1 cell division protein FtsN [Colwellia sp. Arc7-635]
MAHQDYVSRSRAKNKKQSPYKKNSEPTQGTSLKVKLIVAFLVVALPSFGYMLWSIKDQQPEAIVAPKVVKVKKANDLPELPEEKWTYVDELKSKEVEVGEYEVKDKGPYKMQCGSFKTRKQAESLKAKIAFAGLEAQVGKSVGTTSTWYKVYLGPYTKKRNAEKDKHKLKNNSVHGCKIWGWD